MHTSLSMNQVQVDSLLCKVWNDTGSTTDYFKEGEIICNSLRLLGLDVDSDIVCNTILLDGTDLGETLSGKQQLLTANSDVIIKSLNVSTDSLLSSSSPGEIQCESLLINAINVIDKFTTLESGLSDLSTSIDSEISTISASVTSSISSVQSSITSVQSSISSLTSSVNSTISSIKSDITTIKKKLGI